MPEVVIKDHHLTKEVFDIIVRRKERKIRLSDIKFVMNLYFKYAIAALIRGYGFSGGNQLCFRMGFVRYSDLWKRDQGQFTYSGKIFGHTFLPFCADHEIRLNGYNYKPSKKILKTISDFAETDDIYEMMHK